MPAHFASDFSDVSAGATVGTPMFVPGKVTCQGGSSGGEGDLVHISIIPGIPGDGQYIAGIQDLPEVGIKVLDGAGTPLLVNGTEAVTMTTHRSSGMGIVTGTFDFPLQLQLVSRTGTAPANAKKDYFSFLTIQMSMD
ncbi:hypothetical protein [Rahnella sp. PCH160]|uniref:hypothetical protein n=1 Tax=Rahnella sp. PCH160 TaxID=3447928 RepID=UPI0039FCACAD